MHCGGSVTAPARTCARIGGSSIKAAKKGFLSSLVDEWELLPYKPLNPKSFTLTPEPSTLNPKF